MVAPHVGAWIETTTVAKVVIFSQSRPTWARGLKPQKEYLPQGNGTSRPTWARGLKHDRKGVTFRAYVAPHVGAWIETSNNLR